MNKKVLITGGSRGIGKAIALFFAERKFDIAICARNQEKLNELVAELEQFGVSVIAATCDASKPNDIKNFCKNVLSKWGHIDILVNNAGTYLPGKVTEEADGTLEKLIETNLYSAYYFSKNIAPSMVASKSGYIFNIASVAGLQAYPNGGSYSISKFAMIGLSKALREELKTLNVRVTNISPGAVLTDSWAGVDLPENRFIASADIAKIIFDLYHLSPQTNVEDLVVRPILGDI
jgi:short-subunit dehydrogenase